MQHRLRWTEVFTEKRIMDIKKSLINVDDCLLIIIDVQDHFLAKLPPMRAEQLISRVGWLIEVAKILKVPMIVTAEEPKRYAGLTESLAKRLPPRTRTFDKEMFGLADQKNILDAVHKSGRKTAVLVGMETDVCVAHSAIELIQKGFEVAVLADVTDAPGDAHEFGLERMRGAGALVMNLKGLYYEWIRTVSRSNSICDEHFTRIGEPKGIVL